MSALAQEHGINADLLFNWRRLHLQAHNLDTGVAAPAPAPAPASASASAPVPTLMPVTMQPETQPPATQPQQQPLASARASTGAF